MKMIILSLFLLFLSLLLPAQSNQIEQLKEELKTLEGKAFVDKALLITDLFYRGGRYQEAEGAALHVYREAKKINDLEAMAKALNLEGKAIINQKNRRNRAKTALKFRSSNQLLTQAGSTNDALRQDNLNQLKKMAKRLNRNKDFNEIEAQLRDLQAGTKQPLLNDTIQALGDLLKQVDETKLKPRQRKKYEQLTEIASRKAAGKRIMDIAKEDLEREYEKLNLEKEKMYEELIAQEEAIADMTTEQMQNELLLTKIKKQSDSLLYLQKMDSISIAQKDAQLREQEAVLGQEKVRRRFNWALTGIVLIIAIGLYSRYRGQKRHNNLLKEKNAIIAKEKERSDNLLLNILPVAIAQELKTKGKAQARHHPNVSVLFTDFINFSKIAEKLSPEDLVEELDYCFKAFDEIITKYELEKIKTIGDAYMCAGGLTRKQEDHAGQMIKAALEIQQFLDRWKTEKKAQGKPFFEARIGVHTGPIVAGVVGLKKFAYDIWGDTVNVAARLESKGSAGKVNISGDTYELIKSHFDCEYRGKVAAKNKGEIDMYYVNDQ